MSNTIRTAVINSSLTLFYISAVGSFMYYGSQVKIGKIPSILGPITFLLLFVFSAAITSYLVFGKPAQLYVDGKKKEALSLLGYTLLFLGLITGVLLTVLILNTR